MTATNCAVCARDFSRATLKALGKAGVSLAYPQFLPGEDGTYANGFRAYMLTDGRIRTHAEILAMVGR